MNCVLCPPNPQGYDVHAYNEERVEDAFDEVTSAIEERHVSQVGIIGYSQGGGATYVLSEQLEGDPPTGQWALTFTAYIDGVQHDFWMPQTDIPRLTQYHVNYWQHHPTGILGLRGDTCPDAHFDLDVRTTDWGADLDHFTIDDDIDGEESPVQERITNGSDATGDEGPHDGLTDRVAP